MEITRNIDIASVLVKKSIFLFGPRQCGKSWLIDHTLKDVHLIDLLSSEMFLRLSQHPEQLEQFGADGRPIVIDEIQKLPSLLDEVHRLIEKKGYRFLLTGSSARKLRKKGVNLLGGRAGPFDRRIVVSREPLSRVQDGVEILPYRDFIDRLWSDMLIDFNHVR